jgi:hypothetical protein
MKYLFNSYKFFKLFNYYIDLAYNIIIIIVKFRFFIFKIPSIFFYKLDNNNYKFLFLKKFFYISFLKHLFNFYNRFFIFYYFRLKLKGLGYRIFNVTKNLIKVFFNRSNFFYIHIPLCILLKNRTRRLFFISTSNEVLSVTIISILYLKEFVIYRQQGLYYPRQILLIKPGKNKFR